MKCNKCGYEIYLNDSSINGYHSWCYKEILES